MGLLTLLTGVQVYLNRHDFGGGWLVATWAVELEILFIAMLSSPIVLISFVLNLLFRTREYGVAYAAGATLVFVLQVLFTLGLKVSFGGDDYGVGIIFLGFLQLVVATFMVPFGVCLLAMEWYSVRRTRSYGHRP